MLGFHISAQAREKILKPIADEAQRQASAVFWSFSRQLYVLTSPQMHDLLLIAK
jgi:hypothetical protein